jgi:hypothetical protein
MSKNIVETKRPQMTSQYGAYAFRAGLARLYARTRRHTPTHPGNQAQACTHTQKYVILIAVPQQQWFREPPHCYVVRTLPVLFSNNFHLSRNIPILLKKPSMTLTPVLLASISGSSVMQHALHILWWNSLKIKRHKNVKLCLSKPVILRRFS